MWYDITLIWQLKTYSLCNFIAEGEHPEQRVMSHCLCVCCNLSSSACFCFGGPASCLWMLMHESPSPFFPMPVISILKPNTKRKCVCTTSNTVTESWWLVFDTLLWGQWAEIFSKPRTDTKYVHHVSPGGLYIFKFGLCCAESSMPALFKACRIAFLWLCVCVCKRVISHPGWFIWTRDRIR